MKLLYTVQEATLRAHIQGYVSCDLQGMCVSIPTEARDLGVERGGMGWGGRVTVLVYSSETFSPLCTHTSTILCINLTAVKIGSRKTFGTQNFTSYPL